MAGWAILLVTANTATAAALTALAIQGPASINEGSETTYSLVSTYDDASSRVLTTSTEKYASSYIDLTTYSLNFIGAGSSSVSSSTSSTSQSSKMTFSISSSFPGQGSVSASGYFSVSGGSASILGGTVVGAAGVTQDQEITLSAKYTEGGITKLASLPVTVNNVIEPTTTTTTITTTSTTTTTTIPVLSFMLPISAGWSLLSSPIPFEVGGVLTGPVVSVWAWVENGAGAKTWAVFLLGDEDGGQAYATSKSFVPLTSILPGEGFWVNSTADAQVEIVGVPSYGELSLSSGWNLVGPRQSQPLAVSELGPVVSMWKWANKTWAVCLPGEEDKGAAYAASKGFGLLTTIDQADGFWINK